MLPYDIQHGRVLGLVEVIPMHATRQTELMRSAQDEAERLFGSTEKYQSAARASAERQLRALLALVDAEVEFVWPEPEVGWVVYADYEGKGIAHEAATRARDWAYETLGFTTLTSNIVPGNTRSVALAERMGAWFERSYDNVHMGAEMLYRHPGPKALSDALEGAA